MNNNRENIVVGLDIGTTKICVIAASTESNGKLKIVESASVPSRGVKNGEVKNIKDTAEDIIKACNMISEKLGFSVREVFVGIAGEHIKSNTFTLGITRENMDNLINIEDIKLIEQQIESIKDEPGMEVISYHPQDFFIDKQRPINNNPIGHKGKHLEAMWHVITGNANSTKSLIESVEYAGLRVKNVELEPIASSASVLTDEQKDEGVCLIDIGGGTTDLAIFKDGVIRHTAIIPFAGEFITKVIQNKTKLKLNVAEKLKENANFTSALYEHIPENREFVVNNLKGQPPITIQQRYYCGIVHACLKHIFEFVRKEINQPYYRNKLNAGIVLTGGGAMIQDLEKFVELYTGHFTRIGRPITRLSNLQNKKYAETTYATGIGLAILALNDVEENSIISESHHAEVQNEETAITEDNQIVEELDRIEDEGQSSFNWIDKVKKQFKKFMIDEETMKEFENLDY